MITPEDHLVYKLSMEEQDYKDLLRMLELNKKINVDPYKKNETDNPQKET